MTNEMSEEIFAYVRKVGREEFLENVYTFFFNNQSIFHPENCSSFSKNYPPKLFSNCLVDGLLTSIV